MIDEMLKIQKDFQKRFPVETLKFSEIATAIAAEGLEIWHDSDGRWWATPNMDAEHLKEESIDVLHFLLLLWLKLGMDEKEIFEAYQNKMLENIRRQREGY